MTQELEIFLAFLKLGCTCFGGPAAHVGYFRRELIERRKWISEATLSEFLGLTQLLPGPSSSQTGFLIGIARGGLAGGSAPGGLDKFDLTAVEDRAPPGPLAR